MASRRVARLNEQLKREIAEILHREVKDPRAGSALVTAVRTAPDLSTARVFVAVPGDEAARAEALEGLGAAAAFVRGELGRRLHVRRVPELRFELDRSLDHAMRIEHLLHEVLPADRDDGESDRPDGAAARDDGADER